MFRTERRPTSLHHRVGVKQTQKGHTLEGNEKTEISSLFLS